MQKAKLLKLANFLDTVVPAKRFNMGTWANSEQCSLSPECKTTACAFGWAPTAFPRSNLKLIKGHSFLTVQYENTNGISEDFDAAEEFFGISEEQSYYLFSPEEYPENKLKDRHYVAKRIRKFVASGGEYTLVA